MAKYEKFYDKSMYLDFAVRAAAAKKNMRRIFFISTHTF